MTVECFLAMAMAATAHSQVTTSNSISLADVDKGLQLFTKAQLAVYLVAAFLFL